MTVPSPKLRLKTDNHSLADKCRLRRDLIQAARAPDHEQWPEAHATELEPLNVLDLYAGEGNIWNEMRRQSRNPNTPATKVARYTPVDAAARQAGQIRFKITPRLIAALDEDDGLSRYNTIDVDTYGDPWEIWQTILFRIKQPTAVFLTRGKVTYGAGRMPITTLSKKIMGMKEEWDVPGKIDLLDYADRCQLLQPCSTARITIGLKVKLPRVEYYGVFVEPIAL